MVIISVAIVSSQFDNSSAKSGEDVSPYFCCYAESCFATFCCTSSCTADLASEQLYTREAPSSTG
eukprot:5192303-Amphidinium_carterae.1